MAQELVTTERAGAVDTKAQDLGAFPTDAFEFTPPSGSEPSLRLKAPWRWQASYKASIISSTNYTVLDNDFFTHFIVSCAASDRTITLPTVADNKGRILSFCKSDSGVGEIVIDGEGSETINGFTTVRVGLQYQEVTVISTGTEWMILSGPLQPVALEPSLGTWHDIASPASGWHISGYGLGAAWYTITSTGQPSGAKKIKVFIYAVGAYAGGYLYYRPYGSGAAAIVARGLLVWGGGAQCEVPIDSSGRWDIYSSAAVTLNVAYPCSYLI